MSISQGFQSSLPKSFTLKRKPSCRSLTITKLMQTHLLWALECPQYHWNVKDSD